MSVSPLLDIYSVTTTMVISNKLSILIQIEGTEEKSIKTLGLMDSGAGGKFINQNYAKRMGFKTHKLEKPLKLTMWNQEQMRNNQILCQPQFGNKWKEDNYGVVGNQIRERKNHPWIPLVARTKPRYQLEGRQILLERT